MAIGSFQQRPVTGPEDKAQSEAQEVPSEWQETLFYCQDDQALTHVAQREAVKFPSLESFKSYLDTVLGNWLWVALLEWSELNQRTSRGPANFSQSVNP